MLQQPLISRRRMESREDDDGSTKTFMVYGARWHMLAIYCTLLLLNALIWVAFSPIVKEAKIFYGVGSDAINSIALSFQFLFLPGTILSCYVEERKGLRGTLLAGAVLTTLSAIIRLITVWLPKTNYCSYIILFLGTTLAGIAQPLFLNLPAQLAGNWFNVKERDIVTSIGTMFSPIGNALGVSLPPIFVTLDRASNSIKGMPMFMAVQVLATFLATIWAWMVLRDYPPTPPSHTTQERQALHHRSHNSSSTPGESGEEEEEAEGETPSSFRTTMKEVWREVQKCLMNKDYRVILWCFGLGLGFFNALITILSQILTPCGYTEEDSGILGGVFLGSGLVGAIGAGVALDLFHQYRPLLKTGFLLALIAVIVLFFAQVPDNFGLLAGSFAFLGIVMLPLLPVSIENAVECTFPVPEIYSSGILLTAGNLIGIPIVFVYTALIEGYHGSCDRFAKPATIFVLILVAFATLPIVFYRGKYLRFEAEKMAVYSSSASSSNLSSLLAPEEEQATDTG